MKTNDIVTTTFIQPELSISVTADISDETGTQITSESVTETSEITVEKSNFKYRPPQEIFDTHFYCDDIETEIRLESISVDDIPQFIADDMLKYSLNNSKYFKRYGDDNGEPSHSFSYMMYDINDDSLDDYIVKCNLGYIWIPDIESFYKIYIYNEDESYTPIIWDCVERFHPTQYILKTKTNELKDILVLHNSNYPIITYGGGRQLYSLQND